MRIVALIDDPEVIERILRHRGLWDQGVRVTPATGPPPQTVIEPWLDLSACDAQAGDPFPDDYTEPVTMYASN